MIGSRVVKLRTAGKLILVAGSAYALTWGLVYARPDRSRVNFGWSDGRSWTEYPNIALRAIFPDPGFGTELVAVVVGLVGLLGFVVSLAWMLIDARGRGRR